MSNKAILLSKAHDLTSFASEDQTRPVLMGVHYNAEKKRVEATNGRIAVYLPVIEDDGEYPPVAGQLDTLPVDCIIPTAQYKRGLNNIPKRKGSSFPILEHARLDANGKVTLTTTDLDQEQAVTCKPIDGGKPYPPIDNVFPDYEPTVKVALSAVYLRDIADYAIKNGDSTSTVVFRFKDELTVVGFSVPIGKTGTKLEGALMPVRLVS